MDVLQILYLIQSSLSDVRGEQKWKTCVFRGGVVVAVVHVDSLS